MHLIRVSWICSLCAACVWLVCSLCVALADEQALGKQYRTAHQLQQACLVRRFPFEQRASLAQNPTGRKLFELMARKQSNLAVAADVPTVEQLLRLAEEVSPLVLLPRCVCSLMRHAVLCIAFDHQYHSSSGMSSPCQAQACTAAASDLHTQYEWLKKVL